MLTDIEPRVRARAQVTRRSGGEALFRGGVAQFTGRPTDSMNLDEVVTLRKDPTRHAAYREAAGAAWPDVGYEGEHLDLVFTNPVGGPVLRQHIDRAIRKAASQICFDPSQFGTHDGRRCVVTNLYASGVFELEMWPGSSATRMSARPRVR